MLATGLIVAYAYILEAFSAWYGGNTYESAVLWHRLTGPYRLSYFSLIACNILAPQLLWFKKLRGNPAILFCSSIVVLIGMWLERFIIVVTSLHHDFLPSSWGMYYPTRWDIGTFVGTIGLFLALLFLFIRFLPVISIFETRELLSEEKEGHS